MHAEIERAAVALVDAYRRNDEAAYFGFFAPDATFVFHTYPRVIEGAESYRSIWRQWIADGWKVLDCVSEDRRIKAIGDTAILVHRVRTRALTAGEEAVFEEVETIVFRRDGQRWLAVHEHLGSLQGD
jgi:ketosteroid isomerase-like protein